ncbi:tautomerase [Enterococcus silesiacus]|uniref:Tautomerase n=1 Tax=Enterococcus silesiacus TaxID=332949 RepID=A0A0S3KDR5_9ENTE|nr:tautomerase family protein [Enterococcus silesiacus]ALS02399.1 tautomerase [Enterococcus silesiacus]OJG91376.1 4-oxalocrotonate tautomerase [Enterococcus silesiacus]
MAFIKVFHEFDFDVLTVQKVNESIHTALVESFDVPENDSFQIWVPLTKNTSFVDEKYPLNKNSRTNQFIYLEIFCFPGRTSEQKKVSYQKIADRIDEQTTIKKENVFILFNEVSVENWSFGEGIAYEKKSE